MAGRVRKTTGKIPKNKKKTKRKEKRTRHRTTVWPLIISLYTTCICLLFFFWTFFVVVVVVVVVVVWMVGTGDPFIAVNLKKKKKTT